MLQIYAAAREYMHANGNPTQWPGDYPPRESLEDNIATGRSYVCVNENDDVLATFYFAVEDDPTYREIDGKWLDDTAPYGVVHRIARRAGASGVGAFCIEWAFAQCGNLRIDTHENNGTMRDVLDRLGFKYCGIIWVLDHEERIAYQKIG